MAKKVKTIKDYGVTMWVWKEEDGTYTISNNCEKGEDSYFEYESKIHPDNYEDIEYIASYHAEEMACLIAQAQEEFGL